MAGILLARAFPALLVLAVVACSDSGVDATAPVLPSAVVRVIDPGFTLEWAQTGPGSRITLADGVYVKPLLVRARGTVNAPVTLMAAAGAQPVLKHALVFERAAYVRVEGITIDGAEGAGVIVRDGSHHVTLADSIVRNSGVGILVTGDAGNANRFVNNVIENSRGHGVVVDSFSAAAGPGILFSGNRVHDNGGSGFEIDGSFHVIEDNDVYGNGVAVAGSSGIRYFSSRPHGNGCHHNITRYNRIHGNLGVAGQGGGGIQLDQGCKQSQVYYNLVYDNDGAGIILYGGGGDLVQHNTVYANLREPGEEFAAQGELNLLGDTASALKDTKVDSNILVATRPGVFSLYVEPQGQAVGLSVEDNLLFQKTGDAVLSWHGVSAATVAELGNLVVAGLQRNLVKDPKFLDEEPKVMVGFGLQPDSVATGAGRPGHFSRDLPGAPLLAERPLDLGAIQSSSME